MPKRREKLMNRRHEKARGQKSEVGDQKSENRVS
jgi:hypothetical protein